MDNIFYILLYILITIIIISGFMYLVNRFLNTETQRSSYELKMKYSDNMLPYQLQAYERMTLFLERIRISSLIKRVSNPNNKVKAYEYSLIETIQTEYEHNLAQQIYINPETWRIILSAKNAILVLIKNTITSLNEDASIKELQEELIRQSLNDNTISSAILYLQKDIQKGFF